ncbi:hypothetical protein ASPCADRAFT_206837 [Aspergillus carbonarius ITEM 5010]|uniref:Uncharacterized protein n=1 Tax=Aspergillus carbonarius (strain ITEM 5010) TaxID=602072 RepID=A0A1R3RQ98_ASPC5|nr:hypothetical protein ASPCADRAFT_206837 [Aspergillus carbonarius ITEM 5010]
MSFSTLIETASCAGVQPEKVEPLSITWTKKCPESYLPLFGSFAASLAVCNLPVRMASLAALISPAR